MFDRTDIDMSGSWLAYDDETDIYVRPLNDWSQQPRLIGRRGYAESRQWYVLSPNGDLLAVLDLSGEICIWPTSSSSALPPRCQRFAKDVIVTDLIFGGSERWLAVHGQREDSRTNVWLLDLSAPQGAAPLELQRSEIGYPNPGQMASHPKGDWLVASSLNSAGFWPISDRFPWVLPHEGRVWDVEFTPDSKWLVSVTSESRSLYSSGEVRAWPLEGQNNGESRLLLDIPNMQLFNSRLAMHPDGELVAFGVLRNSAVGVVPLAGGQGRRLMGTGGTQYRVAFSPDGNFLAGVPSFGRPEELKVQIWDLASGERRDLGLVAGMTTSLEFVDEAHLLWRGTALDEVGGGRMLFDLANGEVALSTDEDCGLAQVETASGALKLTIGWSGDLSDNNDLGAELYLTDVEAETTRRLTAHGKNPIALAVHPSGRWVVTGGNHDGLVRVGPVSGDEPHLLYGHDGWLHAVKVSPDGRWIASAGEDKTVRVWPMPDMAKPPLHTLAHDELIAKLKTLTNLRVVRDEESSTGWSVDVGPFPGWETVPTW
jgi:WD40 repeat protein